MHFYKMFRRAGGTNLCCAVPLHEPVPAFVARQVWVYAGPVAEDALSGFDATAAHVSVQINGFYLFHSVPGSVPV